MREWTLELGVEVTAEVLARAVVLVHERWGSSALVLGSEGRTLRVRGPDSESAVRDYRFALEQPPPQEVPRVTRSSRSRRGK